LHRADLIVRAVIEKQRPAIGENPGGAMAGPRQRLAHRLDDKAADKDGVAKAHLGLGGVDVDIDEIGRALDGERDHRRAVAGQHIGIGAAYGAGELAVAHRAAIHHQKLHVGLRA
jgi:hypothetical protein